MDTKLKGRHFITEQDWTLEELETLFALAADLKQARKEGRAMPLLAGKTLYMIFFGTVRQQYDTPNDE